MKTHLQTFPLFCAHLAMLIGFSLAPLSTYAITYSASEAIAGIATDITVSNMPPGQSTLLVLPPFGEELAFTISQTTETVRLTSSQTEQAGDYYVSVLHNNEILPETFTFTVVPNGISSNESSLSSTTTFIQPNGSDQAIVTVTARDQYGNVLINRPMKLVSSRSEDTIIEHSRQTDQAGEQSFSVRTTQNGSITLRAIDLITGDALLQTIQITAGSVNTYAQGGPNTTLHPSQQNTIASYSNVQYQPTYNSPLVGDLLNGRSLYGQAAGFDIVDHFEFELPTTLDANQEENLVIIARDRNNQIVEDYEGTVELSSTDPDAILPSFGMVKFNGSDLGRKRLVLGLRFATPGNHLLYGEDSQNPSVSGQVEVFVEGRTSTPINKQKIFIMSPRQNTVLQENQVTLIGKGPPFINLVVTGGTRDIMGETDINGDFTIDVPLNSAANTHTLQVTNENGSADSGEFIINTDANPPKITNFVFDPVSPKAGEDVLVTVNVTDKESSLETVSLLVNETSTTMELINEDTYQYVFTPETDGVYTFTALATDAAGNSSEMQGMVEVQKQPVPVVQNVRGRIEESLALIQWDPITDQEVNKYRIYIGENPEEFLYTLETTISEAKINGLQPGTDYYFGITAIQGSRESQSKSDILKLSSPKTTISVTPGDSSLTVEWTTPLNAAEVATFQLRYGATQNNLTEQRLLDGQLRRYVIEDLINEQKYFIEITPITITGQLVSSAANTAEGTPSGTGWHNGAPDPIPSDLLGGLITTNVTGKNTPPPIVTPETIEHIPETTSVGIHTVSILVTIIASAFGCIWWYSKRKHLAQEQAFFLAMQKQYMQSPS